MELSLRDYPLMKKAMEYSQTNYTGRSAIFLKEFLQQIPRLQYKCCFFACRSSSQTHYSHQSHDNFENNEDDILPFKNEKNS